MRGEPWRAMLRLLIASASELDQASTVIPDHQGRSPDDDAPMSSSEMHATRPSSVTMPMISVASMYTQRTAKPKPTNDKNCDVDEAGEHDVPDARLARAIGA